MLFLAAMTLLTSYQLVKKWYQLIPRYFRPTEVELLIGDATKARTKLGWEPEYSLEMLVKDMMDKDVELFRSFGDRLYI